MYPITIVIGNRELVDFSSKQDSENAVLVQDAVECLTLTRIMRSFVVAYEQLDSWHNKIAVERAPVLLSLQLETLSAVEVV